VKNQNVNITILSFEYRNYYSACATDFRSYTEKKTGFKLDTWPYLCK